MGVVQRYLSRQVLLLFLMALVGLQYLNLVKVKQPKIRFKRPLLSLDFLDKSKDTNTLESRLFLQLSDYIRKHPELKNVTNVKESNNNFSNKRRENGKDVCPLIPTDLQGPIKVLLNDAVPQSMEDIEHKFPQLLPGGTFHPPTCHSRHKVALIVPYRDRESHLRTFLINMHQFLKKQLIDYTIFIVEQFGSEAFNRAMLMNVGADLAIKAGGFQCLLFHDVDLLPEDDRNLYTCPIQPRHMSVAIDNFLYKLPYDDIFGGVSAMTVDQFKTVNGFSNLFWGWGGEDDDMSNRLRQNKLYISRYPANVARYKMLKHSKDKANPERFKYLYSGAKRMTKDGLNSLKYNIVDKKEKKLYTWVLVNLPHLKP